jgi:hypothetical protein
MLGVENQEGTRFTRCDEDEIEEVENVKVRQWVDQQTRVDYREEVEV